MSRRGDRIRSQRPVRVGEAIGDLFRQLGTDRTLAEYDVLTGWEDTVGEQIARVTVPQRIDNGVLIVHVTNAPWRAELTIRRREILERVNRKAGKLLLHDIRFR